MKNFIIKRGVKAVIMGLMVVMMTAQPVFALVPLLHFDDVEVGNINYDAITYVYNQGIVNGYDDGTYRPAQLINRAEFTKIIVGAAYNAADVDNCGVSNPEEMPYFTDFLSSEWYSKYVCLAYNKGVIEGYRDGTFKPSAQINFAEAAKIIVNGFGYTTTPGTVWYEQYVRLLEEKKAIPTSIKSFEQKITRGEMAEMIYRLKAGITDKGYQTYAQLSGVAADYSTYAQWVVPADKLKNVLTMEGEDCVSVDSGYTYGGDLLSTMIASADARALMNLNVYTQAYVKSLEGKIVAQTHAKWSKDFYAFYVCHLMENVDVVAGFIFPQGQSATAGVTENYGFGKLNYDDRALALVHGDKAFLYAENEVRTIGNTATGAEPPICTGEAIMNGVLWKCFMGLHMDANDNPDGETWGFYNLMLDGSKPTYYEEVHKMTLGGE